MQATTKEIGFRQHLAFFDDFDEAVITNGTGTGTDWVIAWDQGRQLRGNGAMSMKTRATTPAAGDTVTATFNSAFRAANQIVLSTNFNYLSATLVAYITLRLNIYTGVYLINPAIRYDVANTKWQYLDSAGAWQDITGATQNLYATSYHTQAIAIDVTDTDYILAGCDGTTWTLTDISCQVAANTTGRHMEIIITIETTGAAQAETLIDDILLLRDMAAI